MGIQWESNENRESNGNPMGIQWESNGNPMGIQRESNGNPTGIQWESNGNPTGTQWESNGAIPCKNTDGTCGSGENIQ
ncbi:hypothetical protein JOQ06_022516 [Pogonophryne albipinna]|uniref:Uncharacterized protein n=1 Tax=Pogonophryne albipinna TaxID=1090488 RepID=A0AAD6F383_9TELE|nr:hypothetical protein JOQ06_022516 [Pogonophryne albipinna]